MLASPEVKKSEVRVLFKNIEPHNPKIEEARNVRKIMGRGEKDIFHSLDHRKIAEAEGRIFENVPINKLPKGQNYTYVILENGEVVYGAAPDAFELGVKHFQLSNKRGVVAAGELRILPDGTKYFNTQSGSYTAKITAKGKTTNDQIAERVEALFSQSADQSVHYTDQILIEEGEGIFPQKYRRYCKDPNLDFGFYNRNLCD